VDRETDDASGHESRDESRAVSGIKSRIDADTARGLVVEAAEQAAEFMDSDQVAAQWNQPSVLEGMTVGGLCAHLVRATGATLAYLDRTDPGASAAGDPTSHQADLLTPVTYFNAALEAPIHNRIKEVSATEAAKDGWLKAWLIGCQPNRLIGWWKLSADDR